MNDILETSQIDLSPLERQKVITDYILQQGSVTVDELSDRFSVSRMTIHRDLDELEVQGVLRKIRGGATALPSPLFEADVHYRIKSTTREKEAIARYAISLIETGQSILLDDSTTTLALARLLPGVKPLTVITNCLAVIQELYDVKGIRLITLGGEYSPHYNAFTGLVCEQGIATLRANTLFMSTSAINDLLAFHQEQEIVKVKQAMMKSASRRILLIDHTKVGKVALHRLASLQEFDLVIVDAGVSEDFVNNLHTAHIPVEVVPV